jgi:hypothetical protein
VPWTMHRFRASSKIIPLRRRSRKVGTNSSMSEIESRPGPLGSGGAQIFFRLRAIGRRAARLWRVLATTLPIIHR